MLLLVALLVGSVSAWGAEVTYTFNTKSWGATSGGSSADWTNGKAGNQFTSGRGVQVTTGFTGANATSPTSLENISQVVVKYSTNASSGAGSISIQVGSNEAQSKTITKTGGTTDRTLTYNYTTLQSGKIKITVNCTDNSIYVKSVAVTYTPVQDVTLSFAESTPEVTLSASTGDVLYTQTVTKSPVAYNGTISYSYKGGTLTNEDNVTIDAETGEVYATAAGTVIVAANGTSNALYNKPDEVTYTLTVNPAPTELGEVQISPASGSYYYGETITLSAELAEHIYYTTNGDEPTTLSSEYTEPLSLTSSMTLKVLAVKGNDKETGNATYTLLAPEAPTFDVAAGAVAENTPLTITAGEGGSTIKYTIDGTDPTVSSETYSAPIIIDNTLTIKAVTMDAGDNLSEITSATYTLTLPEGTKKYVLATNSTTFEEGDKLLIVNADENKVLSTTQNTNNRAAINFSHTNHEITSAPADAQVIELEGSNDNDAPWYFKVGDNQYLYAASSSNNHLKTNNKTTVTTNGKANITIAANGATSVKFAKSSNNNVLQYNSGNTIFSCYSSASQTAVKVYVQESEPATINANVTAAGWATYATKYPMTFEDGDAYVIVSADDKNNTTTMQKVTSVPANTAVLLKGTAGEATVKTATIISGDAPSAPATNYLHIVAAGETINAGSNVYVLAKKLEGIGFYPWTGTALARGKVYMQLPGGAKMGEFYGFGEEESNETDGISNVSTRSNKQGEFYNLAGQRVSNPTKGLYIVNGKKVIIK